MKKLIVPVVLKRSIVANILPNGSYIAVDDFQSVQSLGRYLKKLEGDEEAYLR